MQENLNLPPSDIAANEYSAESLRQQDTAEQIQNAEKTEESMEGWKVHLNVDYKNLDHVNEVNTVLDELRTSGSLAQYKIGQGGGVESGQPGKEATVYIGSFDDMIKISEVLEARLGHILLPHSESDETARDDVLVTEKIAARFSNYQSQPKDGPRMLQYGPHGVPLLEEVVNASRWGGQNITEEEAMARSVEVLKGQYGSFFGGSGEITLQTLLDKKLHPTDAEEANSNISPAQQLGLSDGEFSVLRSDGRIDNGWTVGEIDTMKNKSGEEVKVATINQNIFDSSGNISDVLTKKIPVDRLMSWQTAEKPKEYKNSLNDRQKLIFAPISKKSSEASGESSFDRLFDQNYEMSNLSTEAAAIRSSVDREPNKESKKAAEDIMMDRALNPDVKEIIASFAPNAKSAKELVGIVRVNAQLREVLADTMLNRLELYKDILPDRVRNNVQKNPNHKGYSSDSPIYAREYAVLLALSKLDGSFHYDNVAEADGVQVDSSGKVLLGQHRFAADLVLYG